MTDIRKAELAEIIKRLSFRQGDFVLASGKRSNYYIDCRTTTLDGRGGFLVGQLFEEILAGLHLDAVGGMTMGADPIVSAVLYRSAEMGRPLQGFLVRKEAKGHGAGKQVEGHLAPWMRVALVEDVVTTGGSTLKAIEAVRRDAPGVQVAQVLAIVDREAGGAQVFADHGIPYRALFSVNEFLK